MEMEMEEKVKSMHIVMYPWFAFGHLSSFLHMSNKLAQMGHTISFLLPPKTQSHLLPLNLHPDAISFVPVPVPHLPGLPPGAETTADIPFPLQPLLMSAMDLTRPHLFHLLSLLRPHLVVFDFAHWLPALSRQLGVKSLHYCTISAATIGYLLSPSRPAPISHSHLEDPPPGFPPSNIRLTTHEARGLFSIHSKGDAVADGSSVSFQERQMAALTECDAIAFRTSREVEGPYCCYLEQQFGKPILLAGPVLPDPPSHALEEELSAWLGGFGERSVVYCAFGSECVLEKAQFQQLLLGLERTGKPFLAALKPPLGTGSVREALPEGLEGRVGGRGVVRGEWVQQQLILRHGAVGCFVTHCGSGSLSEAMVTECQLVLVPDKGDQIINARMMGGDLRVGVEVEKNDDDGHFTAEGVCTAIRSVMDEDSHVAKEVRANHDKNRELLLKPGFEASYFNTFVQNLQQLVHSNSTRE